MAADVRIDIAAEFTGKKAFKQAETSTEKLTKGVKRLAGAIGIAYSGRQIIAYGKASVKAAAADEKAQQQLALALKNVGLGRDAAASEDYIQALQSEFGIVDDKLRPAYQTLAVATRDTATAQKLLNLSLDISASTGKELGSVTAALSRAYLGNNTSLSKLGVGISKADLKAKSFEEITSQLATTFAGSATAAANTLQGSMDKLTVASANASEIIGTGLIDALKGLGDDNSVDDLAKSMQNTAIYTADVIRGIGVLIEKVKGLGGLDWGFALEMGNKFSVLGLLNKSGKTSRGGAGGFPQGAPADLTRQFPKTQTKSDKIAKEKLKVDEKSLKLAKAKAVFDLQKIQIEAALKGKISEEDKIRLKLMKAIEDENLAGIEKYEKALTDAQAKTIELQKALAAVNETKATDPFSNWAGYVKTAIELTNSVAQASLQAGLDAGAKLSEALSGARYAAQAAAASSFAADSAANKAAMEAAQAAAKTQHEALAAAAKANADAIAVANKAAQDGFSTQTKAAQEAAAAQIKAAQEAAAAQIKAQQEAAAAQLALLTAGSAEQKIALEAQLKAQSEALAAESKAQMEALQKRLADEAAAYKEAAEAAAAAAQAALLTGANDYTAASLAKIASEAAAQAAAATAAQAAADQAATAAATATAGTTPIEITVNTGVGDPNAIAEVIQKLLQDAANRGVIIGGLYAE
jgi:hypothetical protein